MSSSALHWRAALCLLAFPALLSPHPMGNFSVSHHSRLNFHSKGVTLTYVLDVAEIPAFVLFQEWNIDSTAGAIDQRILTAKARAQAASWLSNLDLVQSGKRVPLRVDSVSAEATEGAGGMPVLRVSVVAQAAVKSGDVDYTDRNFPGRAGWKEIVVDRVFPAAIETSSQSNKDLSKGLTIYPVDPGIAPPQELSAHVRWSTPNASTPNAATPLSTAPRVQAAPVPAPLTKPATPASIPFSQRQPATAGTVVRGDYLSILLRRKDLTWSVVLIGIAAALGLGALHAMSPGHGKTVVAAYLVGSRGTVQHAALLGLVVTFTHTFSVFLLGIGVLFFQEYIVPEKVIPVLGVLSGLAVAAVGSLLLYRRALALVGSGTAHAHDGHFHSHAFDRSGLHHHDSLETAAPPLTRISELRTASSNGGSIQSLEAPPQTAPLIHSHGGSAHSHVIDGPITAQSLVALGVSGGLVPCPSALVLMLSAIALGHPGLGLVLLIGFSVGLASVLIGFGLLAVYARHLLPSSDTASQRPFFRLIPIFSAVAVIVIGLLMAAVSAGWVKPMLFLT